LNAAVPPFHAWLPDAYGEATVSGAVFMCAFTTKTAVYALARAFAGMEILVPLGVCMALYGVVYAGLLVGVVRGLTVLFYPPAAEAAGVGILARVPLASGLLSGKYTASTTFAETDHRSYNRNGEAFDRGETFSGVDFEVGIRAATELAAALRLGKDLAKQGREAVIATMFCDSGERYLGERFWQP